MTYHALTARHFSLLVFSAAVATGSLLSGVPAAAAGSTAIVTSTPTHGIHFTGTTAKDAVVFTRAGTATAPLVVVDADAPVTVGVGCQLTPGDPTRATCAAPLAAGTTLKQVVIAGGNGDDVFQHGASAAIPMKVNGGAGNDFVEAGPGADLLIGGDGIDTLKGGDQTDRLIGGPGDDLLDGGPGVFDQLEGHSGADRLFGGDGNSDDLDGGTGPDVFDGGPGRSDLVDYETRTAKVSVDLNTTTATNGEAGENDRYETGIENVVGGSGDDTLLGNAADNTLIGRAGHDIIFGRAGQDAIVGGDGNDLLGGNVFNLFPNESGPNADGAQDGIAGQGGTDDCTRSAADDDIASTCETIVVDG